MFHFIFDLGTHTQTTTKKTYKQMIHVSQTTETERPHQASSNIIHFFQGQVSHMTSSQPIHVLNSVSLD